MANFSVPTRAEVSENNQAIFDNLESKLGFVPNLYAYIAKNDAALGDYLGFSSRKSTLSGKEKEVVNLLVSQYNDCSYCLSAHTMMASMNGINKEQTIELRSGNYPLDEKLNALARFTRALLETKGKVSLSDKEDLIAAGYTEANIIDLSIAIGTKQVSNYIHNIADFAVDFPAAPALNKEFA